MEHYFICNYFRGKMEVIYEFWGDENTAYEFLVNFNRVHQKIYYLLKDMGLKHNV